LAKRVDLLVALMDATYDGKAAWQETTVPRQFALCLDSGTVLFDEFSPDDIEGNGPLAPFYRITILDEEGIKVDRWTVEHADRWFKTISDFFAFVNETYGRAGQTIEALVGELQLGAGEAGAGKRKRAA
jgi:hypothetical protein